jgi:hypothetical protein
MQLIETFKKHDHLSFQGVCLEVGNTEIQKDKFKSQVKNLIEVLI